MGILVFVIILFSVVAVTYLLADRNNKEEAKEIKPKTKTTAVVLAAIFSFWAWLYVFKGNEWKFWLCLTLTIMTLGIFGIGAWAWAIIDLAKRPEEYYRGYAS